ncbi:MAG: hypothetical protein WCQ21_32585 [Verrucomicrobiota bacterium]
MGAAIRPGDFRESETVAGGTVPGIVGPQTCDGPCDACGIGTVLFRVRSVEEGGSRRATAFVWNLKRERLGECADQQPALTVFEFGPIFVGPQDLDRDVVTESPQMGHQ